MTTINKSSIYENHGKYWTVKETKQLMKEIKIMEINHIANIHKRTPNAIFLKLIKEASKIADESEYDITLDDLSVITSLHPSKLLEGFKKISYKRFNNEEIETEDETDDETDDETEDEMNYYSNIMILFIIFMCVYMNINYLKELLHII